MRSHKTGHKMGFSRVKGTFCASINSGICPKSCHNFAEIISFEASGAQLYLKCTPQCWSCLWHSSLHSMSITNFSKPDSVHLNICWILTLQPFDVDFVWAGLWLGICLRKPNGLYYARKGCLVEAYYLVTPPNIRCSVIWFRPHGVGYLCGSLYLIALPSLYSQIVSQDEVQITTLSDGFGFVFSP